MSAISMRGRAGPGWFVVPEGRAVTGGVASLRPREARAQPRPACAGADWLARRLDNIHLTRAAGAQLRSSRPFAVECMLRRARTQPSQTYVFRKPRLRVPRRMRNFAFLCNLPWNPRLRMKTLEPSHAQTGLCGNPRLRVVRRTRNLGFQLNLL